MLMLILLLLEKDDDKDGADDEATISTNPPHFVLSGGADAVTLGCCFLFSDNSVELITWKDEYFTRRQELTVE